MDKQCKCGEEVWIKKTGECKTCYHRRYKTENPKKYGKTCACGNTMTYRSTQCIDCVPRQTEEEKRAAKRAAQKKWSQTPAGRAAKARARKAYRLKHGYIDPTKKDRKDRRRAIEKGATVVPLPSGYTNRLFEFYGNKCLKCGSTDDLQVDHVVPLTKGGTHSIDNMQPLCGGCNRAKSNTSSADYRSGRYLWFAA